MGQIKDFGQTKDKEQAHLYTLASGPVQVAVSEYGATLVQVLIPDRAGHPLDVVCGYDDVAGYEAGTCFYGAVVGRVANRISGASFALNGQRYALTANEGANCLHGGRDFYGQRLWQVAALSDTSITLSLHSPAGDQGFPGAVNIAVTYALNQEGGLQIHYRAVPEADTLLNLTNHSYFNLAGQGAGNGLAQELKIAADAVTETDGEQIPTGELTPVMGTPLDFRTWKEIGQDAFSSYEPLVRAGGYDHNYVLKGTGLREVAGLCSRQSGIRMTVLTDRPGLQFYAGNAMAQGPGKGGIRYENHGAVCLETQDFPDAIHQRDFAGPVVRAGEVYDTTTIYKFTEIG